MAQRAVNQAFEGTPGLISTPQGSLNAVPRAAPITAECEPQKESILVS